MNYQNFKNLFPVGSHISREPVAPPMEEMKRDIANLKEHGFNMVKIQSSWHSDEPKEGIYDFKFLDELITHCASLDMGVYLGLSMEHAPAWVWQKYPQAHMVDRQGIKVLYQANQTIPGDGKPGPCFDAPCVMDAHLKFITAMVKHLGKHENIVVWNTWQEMGYEAERITGHKVCYCENTLKAFQKWLKKKFVKLENLNKEWLSKYTDWSQIFPNRDKLFFCQPATIAYEHFLENERISNIIAKRTKAIKDADIYNRPVFSHQGSSTVGSGIDWHYARDIENQDFLGCSCYPAWFHKKDWDDLSLLSHTEKYRHAALLNEMWESVALKFDYLRSCNKDNVHLWGAEFQGGPISTGLYKGRVPSKEDIRRWVLTAVSSGATGISFWVTRAEIHAHEINGYSLLDSVGDTTPRYEEAARVCNALNKYVDYFKPKTNKANVAILVDEWNYRLCQQVQGQAEEHLTYSMRGWHRLLWSQGIYTDFVELNHTTLEDLTSYKTVIMALPFAISEESAQMIKDYVLNGGHLITEACPGRFTTGGLSTRGEMSSIISQVLGVTHQSISLIEEPNNNSRWRMPELTWGDYAPAKKMIGCGEIKDISINPNLYIETYNCDNAIPIMSFDERVSAATNNFGKGTATIFGTFIGHSGTAYIDENSLKLVKVLLEKTGVTPLHSGKLLVRKIPSDVGVAYSVTNTSTKTITETISCKISNAHTIFDQNLKLTECGFEITVKPLDVEIIITN